MHLFKKYLNNRGSALFMVISTMTAVMMSCMAMYFSVISSRSAQYAVFNQQQSKQAAISISDAVLAAMMDGSNTAMSPLVKKMWDLGIGEKLTTDGNGYASLDPSFTGEDDPNLGAYMVEITRISENTFDIIVTSSVNGVTDIYHSVIDMEVSENSDAPPAPAQVFAATGYVPNDVFLDGGRFMTDVFFDNEQTIVNAYGGKNMELWGDLATGGSLTVYGYLIPSKTRVSTFAIRNTYTAEFNQPVGFAGSPYEKSTVYIGGDCVLNNNNGFSNANVYILGDLIINGNPDLDTSNYYVDGDIIVTGGYWVNLKNVYCNGMVDATNNKNQWGGTGGINGGASLTNNKGKTNKNWKEDGVKGGALGLTEMIKILNEKTATNQYFKWVINDDKPTKDAYVKELDEKRGTAVHKSLHFSQNSDHPIPTIELRYSDTEKGCIIDDVTCEVGNTSFNHITLIIDTGDSEDNVYTIRVKPNRDLDGDNKNEAFSWYPFDDNSYTNSTSMSILVKGPGSVVVDVPEGVTYQDFTFLKFMHYGWYLLGGAKPDTTKFAQNTTYNASKGYWESTTIYNTSGIDNGNADVNFERFIHKDCKAGDGCTYTESNSTEKCTQHTETTLKNVTCSVHGALNSYCPDCHPEKKNNHYGECVNHVGRKEIDTYLASHASIKTMMGTYTTKNASGANVEKLIYPTTNIFLVSCDESANIRLSIMSDGTNIIQNAFFGYVYAPYMTFKAYGNNAGGGMVRLLGGMTVSDYIIDDSMSMIACWPEKMPTDLMSDECKQNKLEGIAGKSWKIALTGH